MIEFDIAKYDELIQKAIRNFENDVESIKNQIRLQKIQVKNSLKEIQENILKLKDATK